MSSITGIAVLGATGSVGRQSLEVIQAYPEHFDVVGLAARRSVDTMADLAARHRPRVVVMEEDRPAEALRGRPDLDGISVQSGQAAVQELVQRSDVDLVVAAVVGRAGLPGVFAALAAGKRVAIANKESLVMAGELLMAASKHHQVELVPIDSEHAALAQLLGGVERESIDQLILTASGGPFLDADLSVVRSATPDDALAHPTWKMGAKISVDSATMMNKAFEVIEACWLFDLPQDRIQVLVHPESRVHAAVKLLDGSWLAQLGPADMRIPIAQALAHPRILDLTRRLKDARSLDLCEIGQLSFREVDEQRFPALALGRQAMVAGRGRPAALCVADEVLVQAFLDGRIGFGEISEGLDAVMQEFVERDIQNLDDILLAGEEGERLAASRVDG